MARYRVEIAYTTKREAVCVGMTIEAFNDSDAEEIAMAKVIAPYPARQWAYTKVSEADHGDR